MPREENYSPQKPKRFISSCLVPALLFVLVAAFFYPVIFTGHTFYAFDILLDYLPWSSLALNPGHVSHNPLISDPVNQHYLSYQFVKKCIADGTLPLWYDPILGGLPFVPGFTPLINPVVFLAHLFLPLTTAHDLILFLYMFGTGLFMYLYLRQMGLAMLPGAVGAVSWMFNGVLMVWFEFEFWVILSCTLAASLFFAERWLQNRRMSDVLFFTCAVCTAICSGMVHLLLYQLLFTGAYLLYRYFSLRRSPARIDPLGRSDLPVLLLSVLVGVAVSGPLLTSYLAFASDPQRPDFNFQDLIRNTGQLHPAYLLTLLFPDLFGNPAGSHNAFTPRFFSTQCYNNYNELCLYAGILPLFLLPASRSRRGPGGRQDLFIIVAVFSLTMAMGSLLYYPLARFVPGLGFSTPTRILYLFGFAVSVLAGLGSQRLQEGIPRENRTKFLAGWFLLFLSSVAILQAVRNERVLKWMLSLTRWNEWQSHVPEIQAYLVPWSNVLLDPVMMAGLTLLLLVACTIAGRRFRSLLLFTLILLLAFDLISFGRRYNTVSPKTLEFPPTGGIRFLQQDRSIFRVITHDSFLHNGLSFYGIDDIGGYASLFPKRYGEFLHLGQYGPEIPPPDYFSRWTFFTTFGSPHLELLNVKYVLLPPGSRIDAPGLKHVYEGEITIYENEKAFPRAFFVPGHYLASDRREAFEALARFTSEDFKSRVILEQSPSSPSLTNAVVSTGDPPATVSIISHKPDRVEIRVSNSRTGFLVLGDNYDPGWRARVDGRKTEVLRANYIMRAVQLEAGTHDVVLSFRPALQMAGVAGGMAGWIAICTWIAVLIFRRRPA